MATRSQRNVNTAVDYRLSAWKSPNGHVTIVRTAFLSIHMLQQFVTSYDLTQETSSQLEVLLCLSLLIIAASSGKICQQLHEFCWGNLKEDSGVRWEDNIKIDLREVERGGMDWIDVAQDRDRWRAVVNAVMKLRVA